ncbi:hypothetical protein Sango_2214000 [Sesamum angolense]|uniref:Uncharacterized protein n=1 Tax=Sesamum angolense TaxID=2727404 RepID=A0AAE1W8K7_9LAMI|nr:hypothetical protein Sango_2214000 [Sesamum angolense]
MERNTTHSTNRDGLLLRSESRSAATSSSDFVLQWGNRKRLRCMKVQVKDHSNNINNGSGPAQRATARIDRRVVRSDLNNNSSKDPNSNQLTSNNAGKSNGGTNGYLNLRQRPASPSHRILRNSESSLGMRGHSNGVRGLASPDRGDKRSGAAGNNNSSHHPSNKNNNNNGSNHNDNHYHHGGGGGGGGSGSSETAHDGKKGGSSGGDTIAAMWPPKFVIALTNKEKEEDFLAIKGSKLPQRPKKRAKFIQRTLNCEGHVGAVMLVDVAFFARIHVRLVVGESWCLVMRFDPGTIRGQGEESLQEETRGLKAMGNMDSDSE